MEANERWTKIQIALHRAICGCTTEDLKSCEDWPIVYAAAEAAYLSLQGEDAQSINMQVDQILR